MSTKDARTECCTSCGRASLPGTVCSECGEPLGPESALGDVPLRWNGGNNVLVASGVCRHCQQQTQMEFATSVGQWSDVIYALGSVVIGSHDGHRECPPRLRGVSSWSELDGVEFWCYGSGKCGHCLEQVWSRIEVRANKIARIELLFDRPEGSRDLWEFLTTMGQQW